MIDKILLRNAEEKGVDATTLQNASSRIGQRANLCCIVITVNDKVNLVSRIIVIQCLLSYVLLRSIEFQRSSVDR